MDANRSRVTAVAVQDGKIVFVGSDAGAEAWRAPARAWSTCGDRWCCRAARLPRPPDRGGIGPAAVRFDRSDRAGLDKVASYAAEHPELTWIVGGGWC